MQLAELTHYTHGRNAPADDEHWPSSGKVVGPTMMQSDETESMTLGTQHARTHRWRVVDELVVLFRDRDGRPRWS